MDSEEPESPAVAMNRLRWGKTTAEQRSEIARQLNRIRWAGHKAKRPAKGRKSKRG